MTQPDNGHIRVITEALRNDAGIWDGKAAEMGKIGPKAEGLRLSHLELGLFQIISGTYSNVIEQVIARSTEGQQRMTEIGSTLRAVADNYDRIDADNKNNLPKFR